MRKKNKHSFNITMNIVIGVAIVAALISSYFYYFKFGFGLWGKSSEWANLGDFFGGVLNPIFAFSSLVLLLLTLKQNQIALSQNEDALRVNNEELKLTRVELEASKTALENQAVIQNKQSFEGTLFNLLSIHQDLVNSIDLHNKKSKLTTTGKDCFKVLYKHLDFLIKRDVKTYKETGHISLLKDGSVTEVGYGIDYLNIKYLEFYYENQSEIGHYFRNLYNIIKYIDESNIENKVLYTNIVRAQLSTYEIIILFYNSLSTLGRDKFKPLVEKYGLLKGVPKNLLFITNMDLSFYNSSAFNN